MKKATLYIVFFLLALFFLDKAWKFSLSHNLNLKTSYISQGKIDAGTVFLGPCVSLWMMEPDTIEKYMGLKTYNLSTSNSNLAENYTMLYLYLQHNKAPEYLFLYLDHESFDSHANFFNSWQFSHLMEDTTIRNSIEKEDKKYAAWSQIPFIKYAWYSGFTFFAAVQGSKHFFTGKERPYHTDGFELPVNTSWDGSFEKFKKKYPQGKEYEWNTNLESYCRQIIQLAKQKGSKVILYESPVYASALPYYINRNDILKKTENLAKEEGVPYWQFDSPEFTGDKSNFITPLNTSRKGSTLFMWEFLGR